MKRGERGFVDLPRREAMVAHAIKRMWQRRGLLLSRPDYDQLVEQVRSGKAKKVRDADKGCTAHTIEYRTASVVAIFSHEHDCIVTFYPTVEWLDKRGAA